MVHEEEFENYQQDKWWWFAAYLDLGATISANPNLSAKVSDFSVAIKEYLQAMEEYQRQKRRSLFLIYDTDD